MKFNMRQLILVAAFVASACWAATASLAQPSFPAVCSADNGRAIAACAQTCEAACNNRPFTRSTPMAEQLCPRTGRGRPDAPGCAAWLAGMPLPGSSPPVVLGPTPGPSDRPATTNPAPPERPSPQWCRTVADNANFNYIRDALALMTNPEERASVEAFLRTLPPCAHSLGPEGVARRLSCTGTAAEELEQELGGTPPTPFPDRTAAARREFCSRFNDGNRGGDVRQRLNELRNRTTGTQTLFESDSKCIGALRAWVSDEGPKWRDGNPMMAEVIGPMIERVEQSTNEGQENIQRIGSLLRTIEQQLSGRTAAVTLYALMCVVPGETPEPAAVPTPAPAPPPPAASRSTR